MKRIIKPAPTGVYLLGDYPQGVAYDGLIDFITDESADHTGALYAAVDTPKFKTVDGEKVKESDVTELITVHPSVNKRHTFAGWPGVGQDVPPPG